MGIAVVYGIDRCRALGIEAIKTPVVEVYGLYEVESLCRGMASAVLH